MAATQELLLGEGAGGPVTYIEDVFSTYLYTGTGANQTITNNIDLSTKGGLVWCKARSAAQVNVLTDTARGVNSQLFSNLTVAAYSNTDNITAFNANGFSLGNDASGPNINGSGTTYASWTFRKQPKFFDVVTWTGTGAASNTISHNLGATPGCVIMKKTSATGWWAVQHRSVVATKVLELDATIAATTDNAFNSQYATSTSFQVDAEFNASGATYVAYLLAHNAGGFGLTGTDNVISCGSYTGTGVDPGPDVNLGFEPQWLMVKNASAVANWVMGDVMRGIYGYSGNDGQQLYPNLSNAEGAAFQFNVTSTGFRVRGAGTNTNTLGQTYIYIAIRRGPMKVPTDATKVFIPASYTGDNSTTTGQLVTTNFPVDMGFNRYKVNGTPGDWDAVDRLRGLTSIGVTPNSLYLNPPSTSAEAAGGYIFYADNVSVRNYGFSSANTQLNYLFQRAPSFFDVVCYTGTNSNLDIAHNLGVAPELIITKTRGTAGTNWWTFSGLTGSGFNRTALNLTDAASAFNYAVNAGFYSQPTATNLPLSPGTATNASARTYVQYLFATCPGVSKVGSYTGTGSLTTINCGFTGGARFVMIKRTDTTGNWWLWDTVRGMVAGTDNGVPLNTNDSQTNANSVYTTTTGFQLLASPSADVNTNGGTYIYLAIA